MAAGLTYEAGDALGVVPVNCPELVDDVIGALKAKPDENVKFGDNIMSLREALTHYFDVTKPSQELLQAVATRRSELLGQSDNQQRRECRRSLADSRCCSRRRNGTI